MASSLADVTYRSLSTFDIAVKRGCGYALVKTNYFWFGHTFRVELVNGVFHTDSMMDAMLMAHKMGAVVRDKKGVALDLDGVTRLSIRLSWRDVIAITAATASIYAVAHLIVFALTVLIKGMPS
jgi:hypothetical protein